MSARQKEEKINIVLKRATKNDQGPRKKLEGHPHISEY
jgi:hypothetical protein